jgi:hypothetical protein
MPFEVNETKRYPQVVATVYRAALGAIEGLGGQLAKQEGDQGHLVAKFDKKILGKVLGERTHLEVNVGADGDASVVILEAYPLDPVGRKLMFGARKGVTQTVVTWFWAHLEHRLPKE